MTKARQNQSAIVEAKRRVARRLKKHVGKKVDLALVADVIELSIPRASKLWNQQAKSPVRRPPKASSRRHLAAAVVRDKILECLHGAKDATGVPVVGSSRTIAAQITRVSGQAVSHTRVQNHLRAMKFKNYVRQFVSGAADEHCDRRVAFVPVAEAILKTLSQKGLLLACVDEKWFRVGDFGCREQWALERADVIPRSRSLQPKKVHVFAGIAADGSLMYHTFPEHEPENPRKNYAITSQRLVDEVFEPNKSWFLNKFLILDGAGAHKGALKAWLQENQIGYFDSWPACSAHLNPVEHLWPLAQKRVSKKGPTTWQTLRDTVRNVLDNVSTQTVRNLVNSFPHRLKLTREMSGKPWSWS